MEAEVLEDAPPLRVPQDALLRDGERRGLLPQRREERPAHPLRHGSTRAVLVPDQVEELVRLQVPEVLVREAERHGRSPAPERTAGSEGSLPPPLPALAVSG